MSERQRFFLGHHPDAIEFVDQLLERSRTESTPLLELIHLAFDGGNPSVQSRSYQTLSSLARKGKIFPRLREEGVPLGDLFPPDPEKRQRIITLLFESSEPEVENLLLERLLIDDDGGIQLSILQFLYPRMGRRMLSVLHTLKRSHYEEVCQAARAGIQDLGAL